MAPAKSVAWVETHVGTLRQARALARLALRARLAACANLWPLESAYWWRGWLEEGREVRVVLKSAPRRVRALLALVRDAHPYEVPYIAWGERERVTPAYAAWVAPEPAPPRTRRGPRGTSRAKPGTRRRT